MVESVGHVQSVPFWSITFLVTCLFRTGVATVRHPQVHYRTGETRRRGCSHFTSVTPDTLLHLLTGWFPSPHDPTSTEKGHLRSGQDSTTRKEVGTPGLVDSRFEEVCGVGGAVCVFRTGKGPEAPCPDPNERRPDWMKLPPRSLGRDSCPSRR